MAPPLVVDLPAMGSAVGLPVLDALRQVATWTVDVVRVAYATCLLVGLLLHFTRVARRLGKDLVMGGVILALVGEYLIPLIAALSR